jgi:hypothetical protein
MLSFKQFLSESKMRQGLPHFRDLKPGDFHNLISSGKVEGDVTEKTDGLAFGLGYDKDGFYTRSARSDKVRSPGEYTAYGKRKYGEDHESPFSGHYDKIHELLQNNPKLVQHLKDSHHKSGGQDVSMKGEMFWKPLGEHSDKGVKFVGTHYDPSKMGSHGKFVLHTKLPENSSHKHKTISELGDEKVHFDHDKVSNDRVGIDVSKELEDFRSLNHEKMNSRKKSDMEEKEQNKQRFQSIKDSVESKLRGHITSRIKPKFGNETEGHVFHPSTESHPRFKLTSDSFAQFKADQKREKENA